MINNISMKTASAAHTVDPRTNKYRQSLDMISSELVRNSLSTSSSMRYLFRQSLASTSKVRKAIQLDLLEYLKEKFQHQCEQRQTDSYSHIKSTLGELQQKIADAKRQLNHSQKSTVSEDLDKVSAKREPGNEKTLTFSADLNTTISSSGKQPVSMRQICSNNRKEKIKNYYINNVNAAIEGKDPRTFEHLLFSMKVLKSSVRFSSPTFADIEDKKVYIPRTKENIGKKTLILDIDETLIHCEQDPSKPYDIIVPIEVENGSMANAYITIRPYAISFLKRMSKHYEIIAFTASHESYADAVLDEIDPERAYIKHRLYRKNCIEIHEKIFTKDLRIINRDLDSMVLVDNAPYSYIFQLENGIPILPYFSGEDTELIQLEKYLEEMVKCKDVREFNKKHFKLHRYEEYEDVEELAKDLYL